LWLVKSPPWHMKPGMTRWKLDPWYPKPFSPVHSARKFSIVDNQMRSQSSSHPVIQSRRRVESIIDRVDRRPIAPRHAPAVLGTTSARSYDREKTPSSSYRQSSLKARPRITPHHRMEWNGIEMTILRRSFDADRSVDDAPSSRCGRRVDHRSRRRSSTRGWTWSASMRSRAKVSSHRSIDR